MRKEKEIVIDHLYVTVFISIQNFKIKCKQKLLKEVREAILFNCLQMILNASFVA